MIWKKAPLHTQVKKKELFMTKMVWKTSTKGDTRTDGGRTGEKSVSTMQDASFRQTLDLGMSRLGNVDLRSLTHSLCRKVICHHIYLRGKCRCSYHSYSETQWSLRDCGRLTSTHGCVSHSLAAYRERYGRLVLMQLDQDCGQN